MDEIRSTANPTLREDQIEVLMRYGQTRKTEAGQVLSRAGDASLDFIVVLEGALEVIDDFAGEARIIVIQRAGGFVGELNLLTGQAKQWAFHPADRPEAVVDATGVGIAVSDLLKTRGLRFTRVTITGGDKVNRVAGGYRVPKRDLVAALEVPFHKGSLKVAEGLALWPALQEKLLNFRRKINLTTAHDSYEHWRDSDHDDLVLATALACWDITRPRQRTRLVR
jgi:hypothetical protein